MRFRFLAIMLALLQAGCLTQASHQQEAEQLVKQLHQAMQQQAWDQIMPLYDQQFLKAHPEKLWRQTLASLPERYGQLKTIKPTFQQKDPRFRGDFYIFGYLLKFEHGSIRETITVFKPVDSDELSITGHMLKPRG
ncbi:MAG: hypothetical protein D6703_01800 [Zetaproteobacteria bacterium]|nr:MAG: hypothetical protein D6703_01800 [Zetaproteobacteria bacterium]